MHDSHRPVLARSLATSRRAPPRINGRHRRRLTDTRNIDERFPAFSPNGKLIAYERTGPGYHHAVFEMNANGSCPTPLREDHTDAIWYFAPTWQPGQSRHGSDNLKCRP